MKGGQRSVGLSAGIPRISQTASNSRIRLVTGTVTEIGAAPTSASASVVEYAEGSELAPGRALRTLTRSHGLCDAEAGNGDGVGQFVNDRLHRAVPCV